jgi:hypothetical protein
LSIFKRLFTVEARSFTVSTEQMELDRAKDMGSIMKAGGHYRTNMIDRIYYRTKNADRSIQDQNLSVFK